MILEQLSAGKRTYSLTALKPKPIQLSIFSKKSPRPDYGVSIEQIERILDKMSADGLCTQ